MLWQNNKKEISLLWTFAFIYAIKKYQHLIKNKELFLKDTFSFWLTMVDKPQTTLYLVFSLLQTPFPERVSGRAFTVAFTLLDMRPWWWRKLQESKGNSRFAFIYLETFMQRFLQANSSDFFSAKLFISLKLVFSETKRMWRMWTCSEYYLLFFFPT